MSGRQKRSSGRLSRSVEFERVYRRGRSVGGRHLVLHVFPREEETGVEEGDGQRRIGFSVSRRVGGAAQRNRVKRLLREACAAASDELPAGTDLVIVARRDAYEFAEREGLAGVLVELRSLLARQRGGREGSEGSE